ncbi:BfmA/BtgA family mobilization protein [Phocaeicola vulgatus]|uniref:BfmA/BtgA family mobilization protein n=1 Tax=Phocaeicola vulgatus TaxID=821 RepID=UPI0023EF1F25|nr:BfmA/BtgA family mobilization protein [Phocaeicola vulgatus]
MLKGNKSHDAFVAEMLLYFETTGITPQSNVMPPNIAAKEQASRVIEVVRGIEKSTNVRLKIPIAFVVRFALCKRRICIR